MSPSRVAGERRAPQGRGARLPLEGGELAIAVCHECTLLLGCREIVIGERRQLRQLTTQLSDLGAQSLDHVLARGAAAPMPTTDSPHPLGDVRVISIQRVT